MLTDREAANIEADKVVAEISNRDHQKLLEAAALDEPAEAVVLVKHRDAVALRAQVRVALP